MLLVKVFMTAMENTFTLNFIVDTEFYSLKQRLWVYFLFLSLETQNLTCLDK